MKRKLLILSLLSLGFIQSQNIFKDDFAGYATGVPLSSQGLWTNNTSAPNIGLGGCNGTGCTSANVVPQAITYLNYGTTNKVLKIDPNKDGVAHPILPIITGGDFYVAMVLNLTTSNVAPNDFLRIDSGAISNVTCRMLAKDNTFGFFVGIRKGATSNATVYTPNSYDYSIDHLVVMKYSHQPLGDDDIVSVYVDPVYASGEPAIADATVASGLDQTGTIDRLGFRLNQALAMPTGAAGLVSVSTTWAGLGFVPLATSNFYKNTFVINSAAANSGILSIESTIALNNAKLEIFDIQGRSIENKIVSLQEKNNEISINPITNSGIYIVEITSENKKITQKIAIK
jgi:Secretion system C-terminal sorting domain